MRIWSAGMSTHNWNFHVPTDGDKFVLNHQIWVVIEVYNVNKTTYVNLLNEQTGEYIDLDITEIVFGERLE